MNPQLLELAAKLGISEARLVRMRVKYQERYEDEDEADRKLREWLEETWAEVRPRTWLLSRRSVPAYTESPSEAMVDAGEAPPPDEIAGYRKSREARQRLQAERLDEIEDLLAAMTELRAVINAMPSKRKRAMGRSFWILRSRLDAAERDLRRRAAA